MQESSRIMGAILSVGLCVLMREKISEKLCINLGTY